MHISGIQQFTLLDYPERTACVVFTPGCNFRCGYCHNPEFVLPDKIKAMRSSFVDETIFFRFLDRRRGRLDGVVVSGGEPTLMPDIVPFFENIKGRGFLAKLDTNGNRPEVVRTLLDRGLVNYIAMDVKTALPAYAELAGRGAIPERIQESMDLIKKSRIAYEFRTTLIKELHTQDVLNSMANSMAGARELCLQTFRPGHTLNPLFASFHPFSRAETEAIADQFRGRVERVRIR